MADTTPGTGTDPRVLTAERHWMPRFVAGGVEFGVVQSTLARISRWEQWLEEWGRSATEFEDIAREAEQAGRQRTAAQAWQQAGLCWHFGKYLFVDDPGAQQAAHRSTVECFDRGLWAMEPPAQRVVIDFDGTQLPGLLRLPTGVQRPPVVLMLPGLDSTKEELQTQAERMLQRGLATLAVDGPGQGEADASLNPAGLPIRPDYEVAAAAMIDWLWQREDVDASRLGVYGVSLGGYYAARVAAHDTRVRAAVDLAGPHTFSTDWENRPGLTRAVFQRRVGARTPEEARERAAELTLSGVAERIRTPLLVVHGKLDGVVPFTHAEQLAAEAPGAELAAFEDGNHGMTNRSFQARTLMADWLVERLRG